MSQLSASPYINFQGRAREAMEFYQQALGGELTLLAGNMTEAPHPAGPDDSIMHARLAIGNVSIMGGDGLPAYPPTVGDNMAITLMGDDRAYLTQAFEKLSAGGTVKQTLKEESWGDTFGFLVDRFGINWMVDITKAQD